MQQQMVLNFKIFLVTDVQPSPHHVHGLPFGRHLLRVVTDEDNECYQECYKVCSEAFKDSYSEWKWSEREDSASQEYDDFHGVFHDCVNNCRQYP